MPPLPQAGEHMTLPYSIQPKILEELRKEPLTDGQIAIRLGSSIYGARSALNALHKKGKVTRQKSDGSFSWLWSIRHAS